MNTRVPSITVSPSNTPIATEQESSVAGGVDSGTKVLPHAAGITSELLAVIELAASAFLGKRVSILSIQPVHSQHNGDAGVWLSQGRDMQQGSHNLVQRQH